MIDELVIHLGAGKTGSTSIQSVLAHKNWRSPVHNMTYHCNVMSNPAAINHNPLALSVKNQNNEVAHRLFSLIRREFEMSEAKLGVISAENFWLTDPRLLQEAIHRHLPSFEENIRLIAYVGPHIGRVLSGYSECSKHPNFSSTLQEFHEDLVQNGILHYAPRAQKWRDVFGSAFTLRPFIRDELYLSDVVEDFFHWLFKSKEFHLVNTDRENVSLSVEDIVMMREMSKILTDLGHPLTADVDAFGRAFANIVSQFPGPHRNTKLQIHKELADRIVEAYLQDAETLDLEFFGGPKMVPALLSQQATALDMPQSHNVKSYFQHSERRQFKAFAHLLS